MILNENEKVEYEEAFVLCQLDFENLRERIVEETTVNNRSRSSVYLSISEILDAIVTRQNAH